MRVRALSLYEPYASMIAQGIKTIETRRRPTKVRGPLLICAGKRRDQIVKEAISEFQDEEWCQRKLGLPAVLSPDFEPQYGKAVALCELVDCQALEGKWWQESCVPSTYGLYGYFLRDIRRIEPFDVKGYQGFFYVDIPSHVFSGR